MKHRAYYESGDEPEMGLSLIERMKTGLSTAIGAVAALGILFALGVWFYRLGDRDAKSVPIIRADAGPTKKIPDDPGGQKTPHQGIKSYEAAGGSSGAVSAAVITAAPPEPKPEDVPMGELAPVEKPAEKPAERPAEKPAERPAPKPVAAEVKTPAAEEPAAGTTDTAETPDALADGERVAAAPDAAKMAPVRPARPTEDAREAPDEDDKAAEDGERPTIPDEELIIPGATEYAPDKSPYAPQRPRKLVERHKEAAEVAVAERRDLADEAAKSPVQIQLIADPDRDLIVRLWKQIYKDNVDILQGRELAVQSTVSGGVTWYRLRVGPFKSRSEAASICQALKARSQDCIVSRNS